MTTTFRCFVSVDVSGPAKEFLAGFVREAASEFPEYRFGSIENLHLTLQFVGDAERAMIPELTDAISSAASRVQAFSTGLGDAGCFPARGTPRILHVSLGKGAEEMIALAGEVSRNLSELGHQPDKPFTPHITLGRERNRDRRSGYGRGLADARVHGVHAGKTGNRTPDDPLSDAANRSDSANSAADAADRWRDIYRRHRTDVGEAEPWVTGEVLLMESILGPKGPTYIWRGAAALAGAH